MNKVRKPISERTEGEDTVPNFQILFIEGGGRRLCRGLVEGESKFYILLAEEYNKVSHTWARGYVKDLPIGKERACILMAPSSPHHLSSSFFRLVLSGATAYNAKISEGLLL